MRKNIKLNKKPEQPAPKETRFFFVKDQGTGAVRVLIIIFKLIELFLTTVYGVCLGIFAPLALWFGAETDVNYTAPAVLWLVSSLFYIAGLFMLIFAKEKPASVTHGIAAVLTFATYASFRSVLKEYEVNGPAELFMPSLIITVLTVTILLLLNIPEWIKKYIEKRDEKAPSILGDEDNEKESRK